jgi:lysozyme
LHVYDDATKLDLDPSDICLGTPTIGWGHTGADVKPGMVITPEEAERLFQLDKTEAIKDAAAALRFIVDSPDRWYSMGEVRQAALVDMAFNLGLRRLAGFRKMLEAIVRGDWQAASDEVLYRVKPEPSKWKRQVGRRADRDALMFLTGQWPDHA